MKTCYWILIALFMMSCSNSYQEIEFIKLEKLRILDVSEKSIDVLVFCELYNPNQTSLNLQEANFDISINGRKVTHINQEEDIELPPGQSFSFPLRCRFSQRDLYGDDGNGLIDLASRILMNQKVMVYYDGTIKVGKAGFSFNLPVKDSVVVTSNMHL